MRRPLNCSKSRSKNKEYQRILEENDAARQKAIQKKLEEKEYDTYCLQMQEKLLEEQDKRRKEEKQAREARIKARMDKMKEAGILFTFNCIVYDKQEIQQRQEELRLLQEIQAKEERDKMIEDMNKQSILKLNNF
jgi:hypothetical protein